MTKSSRRSRRALNRRDFLKAGSGAVAGAAGLSVLTPGPAAGAAAPNPDYPVLDVAALVDLGPGDTIPFHYPDASSPALLMRLPASAMGGVGEDASIVAFSLLCTHKGCTVSYNAERGMLICPCHWSSFDPSKDGSLIIGQASQSLPRIALRVNEGTVQAVGVQGLIYGRHTNVL
jgi:arsenite oxidase small subunit